jgi:mannose-1-phosphate guanylyltransferase
MKVTPVIMAGGSGTRLWPLSRSWFPKQFLNLAGTESMLQSTVSRSESLDTVGPILLCNSDHRFLVAEQLRTKKVKDARIILEPAARNTAPAIALAALDVLAKGDDSLMLVLAADHVIKNEAAFADAANKAKPLAEAGQVVTFGIVPSAPETGYGYIQCGAANDDGFAVNRFVEKPSLEVAKQYLTEGGYLWNSGMFLVRASVYLEELKQYAPEIYTACLASYDNKADDLDFVRVGEEAFLECPDDSIDYAIMEKTSKAVVVPMDADWSDVGSWSALWELDEKCGDGNSKHGDVILHDTKNSLVHGTSRLVSTIGVDGLIVVETKDAVMVAAKDRVQDVKAVVAELKAQDRTEHIHHREVYRPWGHYDSIDSGERYQVKRITVKPGAKLSVQMHHHRAEHWIVVSGTAKVTNGDKELLLTENQSTYIPVGVIHALENPGKVDLELIEVQSGSYLGEDDIVRFDDRYGRA